MKMKVKLMLGGSSVCLYSLPAIVILLLDSTTAVQATNCTQDENNRMQTQFTECSGRVTTAYQKSMEEGDKEGATCNLFTNLLKDCGALWELCHSEDDIRKMKDMQLEALLGQYVDSGMVTLQDCAVVNEYWSAEGTEEEETGSNSCSDRQYIQTQTKFQTCSHEISSAVYSSFQDITDPKEIENSVCESLKKIASSCTPLLQACFVEQDIRQIVGMHLQEIQGYLISLSTIRVNITAVENCEAHDQFNDDYEEALSYHPEEDAAIVEPEDISEAEEDVGAAVVEPEPQPDSQPEPHSEPQPEPEPEMASEESVEEDIHETEPDILLDISEQFVKDSDIPFENIESMEVSKVNQSKQTRLLSSTLVTLSVVLMAMS